MQEPTELRLAFHDQGASEERVQQLTLDVAADLRRERDVKAFLPEADAAAPGSRGDVMEIGKLVVQLASSGAAGALINVLAAHFTRKPKMTVTMTGANGTPVTISAENATPEEMQDMLRRVMPESAK